MKIRTSRLTGRALDYGVALAEGTPPVRCEYEGHVWYVMGPVSIFVKPLPVPSYSTGSAGDDIIDREKIETRWCVTDGEGNGYWMAQNILNNTYGYSGTTRREAAMRCYVASKFGDEIDLPRMNCTPPNEGTLP